MFPKPKQTRTGLPPGRNSGLPRSNTKSRGQNRAKLTGQLLYGEEAIRALRSNQHNSKQPQPPRQNRRGHAEAEAPVVPISTNKNSITRNPNKTMARVQFSPPPLRPPSRSPEYLSPRNTDESPRPIKISPYESFADFSRRVNTLTANKLNLDSKLHDSFIELSLGRKQQNSAFDWGPTVNSSSETPKDQTAIENYIEDEVKYFRDLEPFEITFGAEEKRSSGEESDSFRASDRYWRLNIIKKRTQDNKKQRYRLKKGIPSSIRVVSKNTTYDSKGIWQDSSQIVDHEKLGSNMVKDGELILKQAAKLLQESKKLRMREDDKELAKEEKKSSVIQLATDVEYVPFKVKLKNHPKLTLHDRLQQRRENIRNNGYKFENEILDENSTFSNSANSARGTFGQKKLSSLIAKSIAAVQGRHVSLTDADNMSPIGTEMVQGLEGYELSCFLTGAGQRSAKLTEPPRPILKKDRRLQLTTGKGQTSLIDSEDSSRHPRIGESRITKYLDDLRLSGYPDMSSKSRTEKRRNTLQFLQQQENEDFDESILDDFNMSDNRKKEFITTLKAKRMQRIRMKAAVSSGTQAAFNQISGMMGGMPPTPYY